MVNLLEMVLGSNGGAVRQIAKKFGLPETLVQQAVGALLPALSQGIQSNAAKPGGLESLLGALSSGGHERYVDQPETLTDEAAVEDGNAILGHILGSKDVSRSVAGQAASETGIDVAILKKMLPMVGAVAMGTLSKQTNAGSQLASVGGGASDPLAMLSGLLGGGTEGAKKGDVLGMFKKLFGAGT